MGTKVKEWWLATTRMRKGVAAFVATFGLVFGLSLIVPTRASAAGGQMTASFVSCQITTGGSLTVSYKVVNDNPTVGYVRTFDTYTGSKPGGDELAHKTVPANSAKGAVLTFTGLPHPELTHEINVGASNDQWLVYAYQMGDFFVKPSQCSGPPPVVKPAQPTASATSTETGYGKADGTATVTVTNTADDTHTAASYAVTLNGVTKNTGSVADGKSGSVTFTGLAAGTYPVTVVGNDGTSTSTSVTVKPKVTPPPTCTTLTEDNLGQYVASAHESMLVSTATLKAGNYCNDVTLNKSVWVNSDGKQFPQTSASADAAVIGKSSLTVTVTAPAGTSCGQIDDYVGQPPAKGTVLTGPGQGYEATHPFWSNVMSTGSSSYWSLKTCTTPPPPPAKKVTAKAPVVLSCDSYWIPSVTGVEYLLNGEAITAGKHSNNGVSPLVITAKELSGYTLEGQSSWTLAFKSCAPKPVVKAKVTVKVQPCTKAATEQRQATMAVDNRASNVAVEVMLQREVGNTWQDAASGPLTVPAGKKLTRTVVVNVGTDRVINYKTGKVLAGPFTVAKCKGTTPKPPAPPTPPKPKVVVTYGAWQGGKPGCKTPVAKQTRKVVTTTTTYTEVWNPQTKKYDVVAHTKKVTKTESRTLHYEGVSCATPPKHQPTPPSKGHNPKSGSTPPTTLSTDNYNHSGLSTSEKLLGGMLVILLGGIGWSVADRRKVRRGEQ